MSGRLDYLSDNLIELQGPVDMANDAAVGDTPSPGVSAKLYDCAMDARLSKYRTILLEDAAAGATEIYVADLSPITAGATILIEMDNGQKDAAQVQSVGASGLVTITGYPIAVAAAAGRQVEIVTYDSTTTIIGIDNFSQWEDGMNMEITLNDGTTVESEVSLIDRDAGYMKFGALGVDASAGNLVKRKIGADISNFADFGTFPTSDPVVGDSAWGFRGTIASDHAEIQLGMRIRGEILYDDGTLTLTRKVIATVINE
jgi:hypothetical protein